MKAYLGMVHGRFQMFHKEHLQYVLRALSRCDNLVIGITNPDPTQFQEEISSPHRHLASANPFTYFQRVEMIKHSLIDCEVSLQRVTFVPFHLFDISKWAYYLPSPKATIQYVRIFSEWEEKKTKLFEAYGFRVEILDRGAPKNIEGVQVRRLWREGGNWEDLVPDGTIRVVRMIEEGII